MTRYRFLGHDMPDALAARFASGMALFDTRYGTHVIRQRTHWYVGVPRKPRAEAAS